MVEESLPGGGTVQYASKRLAREVAVSTIVNEDNNITHLTVQFHNQSNRSVQIQFRVVWFDENGAEMFPDTNYWQPVVLETSLPISVSRAAPNEYAKTYRVQINALTT